MMPTSKLNRAHMARLFEKVPVRENGPPASMTTTAAGRVSDTIGAAMPGRGKESRRVERPNKRKPATLQSRKATREEAAFAAE